MSRSFSVYGDSISTLRGWMAAGWRTHYEGEVHIAGVTQPEDTWWGKVIEHFGGTLLSNASYSGSTVEGFGFPAGVSDERIAHLLGPHGEAPDVVLVLMGINDYGWGGARNQTMGASVSASAVPADLGEPYTVAATVGPDALERFEASYILMLEKIRRAAPEAVVWCVTLASATMPGCTLPAFAYRVRGIEMDDYNAVIKRAAERTGAHVADIRAFGIDYEAVDATHPTARGMEEIASMVCAQMEGGSADPALYPLLKDAPASQRDCFKPTCEGCSFSDVAPSQWSLHCTKYDTDNHR